MFQNFSGIEKSLRVRGEAIAIFRREFLSHSAGKLRGEPSIKLQGYRIFGVSKIFYAY